MIYITKKPKKQCTIDDEKMCDCIAQNRVGDEDVVVSCDSGDGDDGDAFSAVVLVVLCCRIDTERPMKPKLPLNGLGFFDGELKPLEDPPPPKGLI
jgi:hypothetical protein